MKLTAKHQRDSDGAPVVRIEPRTFLDLDEAATALALVYAGQPTRTGLHGMQLGLVDAARQRVLEAVSRSQSAEPELVATYRRLLIKHGVFPDPQNPNDATPRQTRRVARYHKPDGTPLLRVDDPTFLDLDEAAAALALVYAGQPVFTGYGSIQTGLVTAVRERVLEQPGARKRADDAGAADYRRVLIAQGVFPAPDAPGPTPADVT